MAPGLRACLFFGVERLEALRPSDLVLRLYQYDEMAGLRVLALLLARPLRL